MLILGTNRVVNHGPLKIWAERGLIRVEDSRDGSVKTMSVKDCALRVRALNDMIKNSHSTDDYYSCHEVTELQRVIDGYIEVMKHAQEQGMPSDASARRDLVRRRPTSIVIPDTSDMNL